MSFSPIVFMWIVWTLLSVLCWALVNVMDSVLVHRFERHPIALMWSQALVSVPILALLAFFLPLRTDWIPLLLLFGIIGYIGDAWFFHVLGHIDVSVSNIAWSILSLLLAAAGIWLFHESWGALETSGAILIIGGTLVLSLFHHQVHLRHMLLLVGLLASLYFPYYVLKKMAIDHGVPLATVFFWMLAGRELMSFSVPMCFPSIRRTAVRAMRTYPWFMPLNAGVIILFLSAEFFGVLAYRSGPLSLVSVLTNTQPFMVMGIAWMLMRVLPSHAAKELLTRQSVTVKIGSFLLVFVGLALLSLSH